ncbi:peptidase [Melioribacteraceae bacterium 4301-Me]|uniref:M61 family metallopeptidase n=1 Tax=Pyranulibacter aquaticus TaxID=3163344 RepID=UPI00359B989C
MKNFKRIFYTPLILILLTLSQVLAQHKFIINLNDRSEKVFNVILYPKDLKANNSIFQFASTAPGTYQTMDIGRFVKSFNAYDKNGKEIPVKNISTNQWEIEKPENVKKITYKIADTWHTKVSTHPVYAMSGTTIEDDNVVINGQCVFGYFHGMQDYPIYVKLEYPNNWSIGTALQKNDEGYYYAPTYDYIVDSPIMLGNLTQAQTTVEKTNVKIYTYSKTGLIKSENLLNLLQDMLYATNEFLKGLPVDHYTFLFHFSDFSAGAWEHSYSSFYVYKEDTLNEKYAESLLSTSAHEFFHIVTPLNIHSELVENFNYEKPTMSQHLWLYEGITEWAANILQLRNGLMTLDKYLDITSNKLNINDNFNPTISLTTLGKEATELPDQYYNIYNKGAVLGTLLDIKLLELSGGKKGLRELIIDLIHDYGKSKPFSEEHFFDELVNRTYPQIKEFIDKYIKGTEPFPVKDYFEKLGINYQETAGIDSTKPSIGMGISIKDTNLIITRVDPELQKKGIMVGDILYKLDNTPVSLSNIQAVAPKFMSIKVGDVFNITLKRGEKEIPLQLIIKPKEVRHKFEVMKNPTNEQLKLRQAWLKN